MRCGDLTTYEWYGGRRFRPPSVASVDLRECVVRHRRIGPHPAIPYSDEGGSSASSCST